MNNETFLKVMQHEGPATIVTINAHPASIVSTWMSYIKLDVTNQQMFIPAGGMHSIENDFQVDNHVTVVVASHDVIGTEGLGAGFYVHGEGSFLAEGPIFDEMKEKFPWLRKVLQVKVNDVEQKI